MYTKVLEEKCIQKVLNLRNPLLFVGHLFCHVIKTITFTRNFTENIYVAKSQNNVLIFYIQ